jgi:hypothetical protein
MSSASSASTFKNTFYCRVIAAEAIYEKYVSTAKELHDAHIALISAEKRVKELTSELELAKVAVKTASVEMNEKRKSAEYAASDFKANTIGIQQHKPTSPSYEPTSPRHELGSPRYEPTSPPNPEPSRPLATTSAYCHLTGVPNSKRARGLNRDQ